MCHKAINSVGSLKTVHNTVSHILRCLCRDKELAAEFRFAVSHIASLFKNARKDLRDVHLEDFVEDLAGQTVGDQRAYEFLQKCFQ